jgi:hypothetical protein
MGAGFNNGLTLKEIEEVLIQALSRSMVWTSTKTTLATAACFDT